MKTAATFTQSRDEQRRLQTVYTAISNGHIFYNRMGKKLNMMKLIIEEANDQITALAARPPPPLYSNYNPYYNQKNKYSEYIDQ